MKTQLMMAGALALLLAGACKSTSHDHKRDTPESTLALRKMYSAAAAYFYSNAALPPSAPLTPATSCCNGPGHRCRADATQWDTPEWKAIEFGMFDPHYYRYELVSDGKSFRAVARGDLDCDGIESELSLGGHIENGELVRDEMRREREAE
ncbi:MAG: hypothetical protein IT370_23140 [Deltaproteobacteria bacterium]|nr:hypothetical protein [Deltaproteobacteria bacterium]